MRHNRIRSIFCTSVILGAIAVAAPVSAQTAYDGLWNVTIVTKTGSCEPTARYPLTVTDGKITAPGSDVSGKVGREGAITVETGKSLETEIEVIFSFISSFFLLFILFGLGGRGHEV